MASDDEKGTNKVKPRSEYELGVFGLTETTLSLWARNISKYFVLVGITGAILAVLLSFVLVGLFGVIGITMLEFIGTSPLDSVLSIALFSILPQYLIVIFILTIVSIIVYSVVTGAAIHYTFIDYEKPGAGDVRESFSFAVEYAISLIGAQLLHALIVVGLAVVAVLAGFIDPLISFMMIFLIVYIAVRLAPVPAIVVAENLTPVEALKRSWQVTGSFFWHILLSQMIITTIVFIIDIVIAVGIAMVLPFVFPFPEYSMLFVSLISSGLVSCMGYIYLAILYKDLEARGTLRDYQEWK